MHDVAIDRTLGNAGEKNGKNHDFMFLFSAHCSWSVSDLAGRTLPTSNLVHSILFHHLFGNDIIPRSYIFSSHKTQDHNFDLPSIDKRKTTQNVQNHHGIFALCFGLCPSECIRSAGKRRVVGFEIICACTRKRTDYDANLDHRPWTIRHQQSIIIDLH